MNVDSAEEHDNGAGEEARCVPIAYQQRDGSSSVVIHAPTLNAMLFHVDRRTCGDAAKLRQRVWQDEFSKLCYTNQRSLV